MCAHGPVPQSPSEAALCRALAWQQNLALGIDGYGGDESTAPGTSIAEQLVLCSIVLLE
jgi:hypothetical protein